MFVAKGCSSLPSARENGEIQGRSGGTTRELGKAEKAAWH